MNQCFSCRFGAPKHEDGCPELAASAEEKRALKSDFNRGWSDGRSGKFGRCGETIPQDASRSYHLGYGQGNVAREEAENGFDPARDG